MTDKNDDGGVEIEPTPPEWKIEDLRLLCQHGFRGRCNRFEVTRPGFCPGGRVPTRTELIDILGIRRLDIEILIVRNIFGKPLGGLTASNRTAVHDAAMNILALGEKK